MNNTNFFGIVPRVYFKNALPVARAKASTSTPMADEVDGNSTAKKTPADPRFGSGVAFAAGGVGLQIVCLLAGFTLGQQVGHTQVQLLPPLPFLAPACQSSVDSLSSTNNKTSCFRRNHGEGTWVLLFLWRLLAGVGVQQAVAAHVHVNVPVILPRQPL